MLSKVLKVGIFILLLVVADKATGFICKKLYYQTNDFLISKLRHTLAAKEDVLILGSSRAEYHFIPEIIKDSSGSKLSMYNCGIGGADLLFSEIQLTESLKKHTPKAVVLEVSPSSFFIPNAEKNRKLLLPFHDIDTLVYNSLTQHKMEEEIKFLSSVYPYSSTIASSLKGWFKNNTDTLNGFKRVEGIIDTAGLSRSIDASFMTTVLPADKIINLQHIINCCSARNIKLIIVSSPVFKINDNQQKMIHQLAGILHQYNNVHYLDYTTHENIYGNNVFFKDNSHLNYEGAAFFSGAFAKDFKKIMP